MKQYLELKMDIFYMEEADVLTYSNGKDNDTNDDDWYGDL